MPLQGRFPMIQSVRSHTGPAALIKLAQDVLNTEIAGLAAVRDRLNARTPEKAPLVLALGLLAACTGRVVVTGIGKSGLVGRKLAATFSSTGTPAFFLHPVEGAHGDLGSLRKDDVIIAISNSGETAELNAILPALKSLGTSLIAMTGREDSTLGRLADVTLHSGVPREACPHGLAPTASTTAVLALGDALAVCLMQLKSFTEKDFLRYHPGGSLGQRLKLNVSEVMRTEGLPQLSEAPVSTVMTPSPRCGTQSDTVATLLELMESKAITVLPIADEERRLLGMVHMHDLLGQGSVAFSQH